MSKDITGHRFGTLTAVKATKERRGASVVWVFKCDCGTTVKRSQRSVASSVRRGCTPSCGCQQIGLGNKHAIDLFGERYGHLTVIEFVPRREGQPLYWKCRCDCGKETIVRAKDIRYGTTTSCGCQKSAKGKTYAGTKHRTSIQRGSVFHNLTVTKAAPRRDGNRYFHCQCGCGAHTVVRANLLTTGQTRSCGCLAGRPARQRRAA